MAHRPGAQQNAFEKLHLKHFENKSDAQKTPQSFTLCQAGRIGIHQQQRG
jgi:hypothetical protein